MMALSWVLSHMREKHKRKFAHLKHSMHCSTLPCHALDQHTNRHTTRECMRIDDNVRADATLTEWHINLWPQNRKDSLLAVPTGELIPDDWIPWESQSDAKRFVCLLRSFPTRCSRQIKTPKQAEGDANKQCSGSECVGDNEGEDNESDIVDG